MNRSQLTIMDILRVLLSNLLIILLAGAAVGSAVWAYTTYKIPKMYRANVTFYAMSTVDKDNSEDVSSSSLTTSRQLASTYSYVLCSNLVMKEAAAKLKEMDVHTPSGGTYSFSALKSMTTVKTTNTEIFTASFSSSDKANLQTIANTIAETGAAMIKEIIGGECKILDTADKPGSPYSPDVRGNTATGVAVGILIAAAIVVIRALTDTTIWNEEDLSKQFDIPVLGSVPQLAALDKTVTGKE